LARGEAKYRERVEDVRVLKLEVKVYFKSFLYFMQLLLQVKRWRKESEQFAEDSKKADEAKKEILR